MNKPSKPPFSERVGALLGNPLYNFASILITIASLVLLILPVARELTLDSRELVRNADRVILYFFLAEMLFRLLARRRRRYISSLTFWLDLIVVFPLWSGWLLAALHAAGAIDEGTMRAGASFPGMNLLQGVRALRLVHLVQFFYLQKQMGLNGDRVLSTLKARIFAGTSSILFFIILGIGIIFSYGFHNLTEAQKQNRMQQIRMQSSSYGVLQAKLLFENYVMAINITQDGQKKLIPNERFDAHFVETHYRYGEDYIQLDNVNPGESVRISYRDLNRRRDIVELAALGTGLLVIVALLMSLNFYLERLVLDPVERATRVLQLRLNGEEIEATGLPLTPFTEITSMVHHVDHLYQKMRAPARRQLPAPNPPAPATPESNLPLS